MITNILNKSLTTHIFKKCKKASEISKEGSFLGTQGPCDSHIVSDANVEVTNNKEIMNDEEVTNAAEVRRRPDHNDIVTESPKNSEGPIRETFNFRWRQIGDLSKETEIGKEGDQKTLTEVISSFKENISWRIPSATFRSRS